MRAVAMSIFVVAALAVGAVSIGGAAAASHRAAKGSVQGAIAPSWSPDGKQIAFAYIRYRLVNNCCGQPPSLDPTRYRIVRTSSRPGGAVHTVLAARGWCCTQVQWAAGGRILVHTNSALKSVGMHGGKPKRFPSIGCVSYPQCYPGDFLLSPNRKIAAVTVGGDVHSPTSFVLAKVNAATPVLLSSPPSAYSVSESSLAFSPTGKKLVFSQFSWDGYNGGPPAFMAVRIGSLNPVPLARSGIPGAALVPSDAYQAQWSPDGRWVAYVEYPNLEVVATTGASAPHVLATCFGSPWPADGFSWSPTSKLIAYDCANQPDGSGQIMTVRPDGTQSTNLLEGSPLIYDSAYNGEPQPQWSPNGSRLLFLAHRLGQQTTHVYTIRPNGSDLTRVG